MDCADVRDAFAAGTPPTGSEAEAHARSCAACAEVLTGDAVLGPWLGKASSVTFDTTSLLGAVNADLDREVGALAFLRSRSTTVRVAFAIAAGAALALFAFFFSARLHWRADSPQGLAVSLGVYAFGIVGCTAGALRALFRPEAYRSALVLGIAGLVAPFALAFWPSEVRLSAPHALPAALACFAFGAAFSLPFLGMLWALGRELRPGRSSQLLLAAGAGLLANLVLELHCAFSDPVHLALGHATAGGFWLLALSALGGRDLRR